MINLFRDLTSIQEQKTCQNDHRASDHKLYIKCTGIHKLSLKPF
jgi:hypothetical protein